ncbi:MAG TPA: sulfotransferase [Phycisphaerales bacterium]|nr:sulfotransferase [Phycisphaerales bacterium]
MNRLPDFIIIGAMKAATSTLHEQLAAQPGIFMSRPKEPNFFSDDSQYALGINWYTSLFAAAPSSSLCGESSTHYTKLPTWPHTIARMQKHFPLAPKCIYIMRDPIDRLISHYIHEWTQQVISEPINTAIDSHPELIHYSCYAKQIQPFLEAFGSDSILPVFFESLSERPQFELERVCRFIGYADSPHWNADLQRQNASAERLRKSAWRDALTNLPGMAALRRTLIPRSIRDWVKSFWSMKNRPVLTPANRDRLTSLFNEDLAILSRYLGCPINVHDFRAVALQTQPHWVPSALETVA